MWWWRLRNILVAMKYNKLDSHNQESTSSSFSISFLLHFVQIRSVASTEIICWHQESSLSLSLTVFPLLVQFGWSSTPQVMPCRRWERNKFRSFRLLSNVQPMDEEERRRLSVEHAFVTLNKWIPIRPASPQPPSFVVIDNPIHPYSGMRILCASWYFECHF